jgi:outer membrane protein assembly complex protein YaeT
MDHPISRRAAAVTMLMILITLITLVAGTPALAGWEREAAAYKGWKTAGLSVRGLDDRMASSLKVGLALSDKPDFYIRTLEEDISRTALFLARRGYPYASIDAAIEPDHSKKELRVVLVIDRGPPVKVGRVRLEGVPEQLKEEAGQGIAVESGGVFADKNANATREALHSLLQDAGYARAKVSMNVEAADSVTVNVTFKADAGAVNYFRKTDVEADRDDLVDLAERVTSIKRGERYRPRRLRDTETNLRRLDLFRRIRIDTREVGADSLDIGVDVAMRDPRTLKGGISYWNDEGFRLNAGWRHRNIFRRGRGLDLTGSASKRLQQADASVWWPALIAARTSEAIRFRVEREDEDAYEEIEVGVELSSVYYFTMDNNIRSALSVSDIKVNRKTGDPIESEVEEGLLTEFSVRANQSSTDDTFNPRSGLSSWTGVKWAPSWAISDNRHLIWEGWGAVYLPVIPSGVLATRINLGFGTPLGDSEVILPSRRFFSGGSNSMRGFSRRKLGPKDDEGAPLGGEAKVEASVEVRRTLFWEIWGTIFMDAGQVWYKTGDINLGELEVAVGPGIWLMTPIGPLRFDAGYRLTDRDKTESRWAYHIAIGAAY